jgi:hypothetical protein
VKAEGHKTRDHITTIQTATDAQRDLKARRQEILNSLRDKDMNARRNQIEKHHTKTFKWVYDTRIRKPWDSFTHWLSSAPPESSIYWICGKAASGKSTLMKFLINDERTSHYLFKWSRDCAIYSHFIWNAGTKAQRSILGLLRSLLHQIFLANDLILDDVIREFPKLLSFRSYEDWSRDDLEEILFRALVLHKKGACIFVDGMDEIDPADGPFDLLELVKRISALPDTKGLKVCVSSRPESSFKLGLDPYPKLRLQDLTKQDVEIFAKDFTRNKCSFGLSGIDETEFVQEIVSKANGVFLWVSLALKSLQRGLTNGDDPTKLMERLRALPSDLAKLYDEMLKRQGDDRELYRKEAATLFNIFMFFSESMSVNLFLYAVAIDPTLRDLLLENRSPLSSNILRNSLLCVDRTIASRCAGILELFSLSEQEEGKVEEMLAMNTTRPWESLQFGFIHRSAKEFLLSKKFELLDQDPLSDTDRKIRVIQAVVLEDIYRREVPRDRRTCETAMRVMANTKPQLSDTQELDILNLMDDIYQQNGWAEFYENATKYGFQQPFVSLLDSASGNFQSLRNYLLVCALSGFLYTKQNKAAISRLLEMGADCTDFAVLIPSLKTDSGVLYFPVPLLGYFSLLALPMSNPFSDVPHFEEIVHLCIQFGANIEAKFLYFDATLSGSHSIGNNISAGRPIYEYIYRSTLGFGLIVEVNFVNLISDSHWSSGFARRLRIDAGSAQCEVLLCFYKDTFYSVDDEVLNLLDILRQVVRQKGPHDKDYQKHVKKIVKTSKGKEVKDPKKWLTNRGYLVADVGDMEGVSPQATIHEMAAIYQQLNEKFGKIRVM